MTVESDLREAEGKVLKVEGSVKTFHAGATTVLVILTGLFGWFASSATNNTAQIGILTEKVSRFEQDLQNVTDRQNAQARVLDGIDRRLAEHEKMKGP